MQLCYAQTGKYVESASHKLIRNRKWLVLVPLQQAVATLHVVEQLPTTIWLDGVNSLSIETCPIEGLQNIDLPKEPEVALLNADRIELPLIIRKWKQGDYFYPLGMQGKKKIARFLIDQKVPAHQKEKYLGGRNPKKNLLGGGGTE